MLLDANKQFVDGFAWGTGHADPFGNDVVRNPQPDEYIKHTHDSTHIAKQCAHALLRTTPCVPVYAGQKILINELVPNPAGDERAGEYIELFNPGRVAVNLHGWVLGDASASGRYTFPAGHTIAPRGFVVVPRAQFGFALNNSNETVTLWAPGAQERLVVDRVHYARSAPEGASLNRTPDGRYRWSRHRTPGAVNVLNTLPRIESVTYKSKLYKNVRAQFAVTASDADGEKLHYRWDFGDGHRSYLAQTSHTYAHAGTYHVILRVRDASEEVTRDFTVTVTKYPRTRVLKIRAIAPNPQGKDTKKEYILLQNTTHETIRLAGWSIATGSNTKTLVNHPLRIDTKKKLRAGEKWRVTADDAAITLPNSGGVLEVRRPDGSVAHRVTYDVPEGYKSIPDNAVYRKRTKRDGGGWVWDLSHVPAKKAKKKSQKHVVKTSPDAATVRAIIAQAWRNEFGVPAEQEKDARASDVRGASVVRTDTGAQSWRTRIALWLNALLARATQTVAAATHAQHDDLTRVTINRAALRGITPHPAVVTLALTGLGESMDDVLGLKR